MSENQEINKSSDKSTTSEEISYPADFDKKLNSALTSRNKQIQAQMFEMLESFKSEVLGKKIEEVESQAKSEVEKYTLEIANLKQELAKKGVQEEISRSVKGKLAQEWEDIALEKLMGKVKFENGEAKELDKVVSEFLSDPANKRFLPAPSGPTKSDPVKSQPIKVTGSAIDYDSLAKSVLGQ